MTDEPIIPREKIEPSLKAADDLMNDLHRGAAPQLVIVGSPDGKKMKAVIAGSPYFLLQSASRMLTTVRETLERNGGLYMAGSILALESAIGPMLDAMKDAKPGEGLATMGMPPADAGAGPDAKRIEEILSGMKTEGYSSPDDFMNALMERLTEAGIEGYIEKVEIPMRGAAPGAGMQSFAADDDEAPRKPTLDDSPAGHG